MSAAARDMSRFLVACLLGALIFLGLLALGADRRCAHDPSLALCEPTTTTERHAR